MKKSLLLLFMIGLAGLTFGQKQSGKSTPALKGNGEVFYLETFDWGNPNDPKGWTAPPGFYMEDPLDIGYNWHWWPNDSLVTSRLTREPPMRSTTAENGSLCLFLDLYNDGKDPRLDLDNSVVFPVIDCSSHSSVIVRYETCFMNYNYASAWDMLLEVSTDNWVHSAQYDVGFGCDHKGRPNNTTPGKPAIFEANITDVAAGSSSVQIKFTWRGTSLYWWQIDDFQLSEAWNNDLRLKFAESEWDDGNEFTLVTPSFMMPKSQIVDGSFTNFKGSALNFGENDQENVYMEVDITKNNQSIFTKTSIPVSLWQLEIDTALIVDPYMPVDFGHYKIAFTYKQEGTDDSPENNMVERFFHVTDSVYSRGDDSSEEDFCWGMEAYGADGEPNLGHVVASIYPIYADCEINSISAYIAGGRGDGQIDFRFVLFLKPTEGDDLTPIEWLVTDWIILDSSLMGTWITMPIEKDGESEFLFAGDLVYAGVEYNNMNTDIISHRYENFKLGADYSVRLLDPVSAARNGNGSWSYGGYVAERNLMVRMNINDHSNIGDGVDVKTALSSIGQNYPNPFSQTTEITYELVNGADVTIEVMDLTGRKVMEMNEGQRPSGKHTALLNAVGLEAGVYFYTMRAGKYSETKRMVVR